MAWNWNCRSPARYITVYLCLCVAPVLGSEHRGEVIFNGLPVPGAVAIAKQGDKQFTAVTDTQGRYSFPDLPDGPWTIEIEMTGFAAVKQGITVASNAPPMKWELKLLPLEQMASRAMAVTAVSSAAASVATPEPAGIEPKQPAQTAEASAVPGEDAGARDGFLINGSVNNGAASPFAQAPAFGNNRAGKRGLYTGGIGVGLDNSALDATPFSLTGQNTPKPSYNDLTGIVTLGGPLRIPHLLKNGPNFFLGYQWTRNRSTATQSAFMPLAAERDGIFSNTIIDPLTGAAFAGNMIPQNRISPQARALLQLYPVPNFNGVGRYNYQLPLVTPTHQDALQSRFNKTIGNRNQLYGAVGLQSTRTDALNVFGFLDTTDLFGISARLNWSHRFGQRMFLNLGYQFSRYSSRVTPYFANRENISGNAGILGNNQDPVNWGPPGLTFSSGIAGLSDSLPSFDRNQTNGLSYAASWNHGSHNFIFGGDFRRLQFNDLSQQDPRGSFTFTGAATRSDFADFLLGIPDTSSIAFGNADKYFRESAYDIYAADDWRLSPELTLNLGMRWEYSAPITELYGRLVNLDIVPGFAAAAPVAAREAVGPLTGTRYPESLLRSDKSGFEPRVGIAWRPIPGSSMVVRAGYGVYYNTSVYQDIVTQLAQQPPLSKTLRLQNSAANPLTLANAFNASPGTTANTFAIDPNFRVGYAHTWQLSVQRDLPGSLQMVASYLGIKGTRGLQEYLPNTVPMGAVNPCSRCPAGFVYLSSNGNSTREAAQIQLRRRLHNGLTGIVQYTFSKTIDNDASLGGQGAALPNQTTQNSNAQNSSSSSGGPNGSSAAGGGIPAGSTPTQSGSSGLIAQNWLDLSAERSLSSFDQRHAVALQLQYTTGMGIKGGTLLGGWKGALFKEWTFATQITAGSGLPQTPVYVAAVPGTGITGTIRPEYTGAPLYSSPPGLFLNPSAYITPAPGQWGNAGRNSITGPVQFSLGASMGRTFRLNDRLNLDLRLDSTNALNHVTYTTWNTNVNNAQFGLPVAANAMRRLQTTIRVRF